MRSQRGGFVMGVVVGLLVGLALALGVALYITKTPVPFVNKVPNRTAEQDTAEAERNRNWDPNAPLGAKNPRPAAGGGTVQPAAGASAPAQPPVAATRPAEPASAPRAAARDPAAILAGKLPPAPAGAASGAKGADPFIYFVQAGAFTNPEDAEQQRARLGLMGQEAKVTEREQSGRTIYRVRLGPFKAREEAETAQQRLTDAGMEARLVRVERQS